MNGPRQHHGRTSRRLGCLLYLMVLVSSASGQGIVLGKREFTLDFGHLDDQEKSTTDGVTDLTFRQKRWDERLLMRGDLYVIDPALLIINFNASFGFLQDRVLSNGERLPSSGRLIGYDVIGNFLQEKNYSATVFANHSDNIDSREFIGTAETENQSEGVILSLKGFIFPSTLSYRQESYKEISNFGGVAGRLDDSRGILTYDGQNRWESHDVGLHTEFADFQDNVTPSFSYGSRTVSFYDRYHFGEQSPKVFTSRLNYMARGGRLRFSTMTLDENLRIEHTHSLTTGYNYLFSRSSSAGLETDSHSAVVSLQHRLYESLRSGFSLRGTHVGIPGGTERILAVRGDTSYRKKIRWNGRMLASLGGLYQVSENRLPVIKEMPIFQESHTARIGIPFRLDQPLVIPESIVVSSPTGMIFQEGLDYAVRLVGEFTEIEIISTGRIREGDNLAVDYRVSVSASITYSTKSMVFNAGPDFGWVNPYYSYERSIQTLLAGVAEAPLENLRTHAAGVRFRWSGAKFSGSLQNEYRNQNSTLLPFRSLEFSQYFAYAPRSAPRRAGGCADSSGQPIPPQPVVEQPKSPCSTPSGPGFLSSFTMALSLDEAFYHYRLPLRKTEAGTGRFSIGWSPQPTTNFEAFVALRLWEDTLSPYENFRDAGVRIRQMHGKILIASTFDAGWRRRNGNLMLDFRWSVDLQRRF